MNEKATAPMIDARDLQQVAIKWVVDRLEKDWSEERQAQLDTWLEESPAHLVAYWCAEDNWNRTDLLSALQSARPFPHHQRARPWMRWIRRAAAVSAIAAMGTAASVYVTRPSEQTYKTALGGRETLSLKDGSQIELNTDTIMRIGVSGGRRTATLDRGEAFFQIKHDDAHPFIVNVGRYRVLDVGTKFSVRTDADRVRVALVEGAARFGSEEYGGEHSALLKPGEVALATSSSLTVSRIAPTELNNDLAWRRGILVFDNKALGDVAAEFNRYNDRKIIITNENVGRMKIMGSFQVNDLHAVASMAREVFQLRVVEKPDEIVISR